MYSSAEATDFRVTEYDYKSKSNVRPFGLSSKQPEAQDEPLRNGQRKKSGYFVIICLTARRRA